MMQDHAALRNPNMRRPVRLGLARRPAFVYVEPMTEKAESPSEAARREAAALVRKGNAQLARESAGNAVSAFRKALDLVPGHEEAGFNLGVALAEAGRPGEAVDAFRALIAARPDIAAAHAALARALDAHRIPRFEPGMRLTATDALDAAIAAYRKAIHAMPMVYGCYRAIADLLMAEGRLGEAETALAGAALFPQDMPDAMLDVGATLQHPGDLAAALVHHRKAVALAPDHAPMTEDDYLATDLTFTEDEILLPDGFEVMMEWERPIMERSAEIVSHNHGDVLNVGFGMAIIDTAIQKQGITTHTIIEAHSQVIERAKRWAADKKGVRLVHAMWQAALDDLPPLDGIYFDTLMPPMIPFLERVPGLLKPTGVFLYFQYMIQFENLEAMAGNGLSLGIEMHPFDRIPDNAYYRLTEKNADGRYTAPLFIYRKPDLIA
jgi:tetratricopeptide (TPR) repeat protein